MKAIGGQAVIEGVMMKSPRGWTVAVRDTKGVIHVKAERLKSLPGFMKFPLLRGVVALFHALVLGIKAIEFSAVKASEAEEEEKPLSRLSIALTIGFAIILGIALFILLPLYATKLMGHVVASVSDSSLVFNLVDGVIRVFIFLMYIFLIGLWKEMRSIFEYHGAEHKVIHAYEAGMNIEGTEGLDEQAGETRKYSPHHPRCGTSFLLIVMMISILVFSFIPQAWPFLYKFLARIALIPVIAGVSFELLKLSAKMQGNALVRALILPGLLLQRLTTREPSDRQVEVALTALAEVLKIEEALQADGAADSAHAGVAS